MVKKERGGVIASILIIEDDPQVRLFLRQLLEAEGHVVLQASNGRQGLRIAQMTSPDLVITDVLMPDKDGLEVTVTLHRESPATRIIAFSGSTEEVDYLAVAKILGAHRTLKKPEKQARELGAAAFIEKEFSLHRLGETLDRLLSRLDDSSSRPPVESRRERFM